MNAIEEIKMKMLKNNQGDNNTQQQKMLIPARTSANLGKIPGKLNADFLNKIQSRFGGNPAPQKSPKKPPKEDNDNIGQFIEDKNEQKEENQINEKEEELQSEDIKDQGKDKLKILCNIVKSGGRNGANFKTLFNELTWEQRGKVEIMAVDQKKGSLHIYNELLNKIEEIKTDIKFPLQSSYINLPPYLYISGGKVNGKDSVSLQRIQRTGHNSFKTEELAQFKQGRSNHCTIYIKNINCLIFISGSRIKSCEKYNFTKEKMEAFPGLKVSRERCCACLIDEKYLYVFLGFDRTKNKFETTIERIFFKDAMSWESINITGNQNILKKQNFACIPVCKENKKSVIIVGGINSLRNETKETVQIDLEINRGELYNQLPFNSSFTNSQFNGFDKYSCSNDIVNISNEFNVVRFNLDNNNFYGL
jgi:hypothetical protein